MKRARNNSSSPGIVVLSVALFAAIAGWFNWFSALDVVLYDVLIQQNLLDYPDDVVVVAIDEASIERLGAWPWDRRHHARILAELDQAEAVVFDLIFSEPQSSIIDAPSELPDADSIFIDAIKRHGKVVLPVFIEPLQYRGVMQEVLPIPGFANVAQKMGHAHVEYDENGIARGIYLKEGLGRPYWSHMVLALMELLGEVPETVPGERANYVAPGSPYVIYRDHYSLLRFIGRPGTVYRLSYVDVLDGLVPAEQWLGKRVFVGAAAKGLGDEIPTPVGALPGVEFHANAYQALRQNGTIVSAGSVIHTVTTVLLVAMFSLVLSRLTPAQFLYATFFSGILVTTVSAVLFVSLDYWFSPVTLVLSLALFYPLWSWRRIEIALFFLQEELAMLKLASSENAFTLLDLRKGLADLETIGVVDNWQLELQKDLSLRGWPQLENVDNQYITTFVFQGESYRLQMNSAAALENIRSTLAALLSQLVSESDVQPASSYELVERTIREIYFVKDIAEKAQSRMNKSMAQLQDAVLIADAAGKVVFTNENFCQLFSDSLVGESIVSLQESMGAYVWLGILRELMVDRLPVYQEIEVAEERYLLCQAAIIADHAELADTMVCVFTDVTQLRHLERSKNEALAFLSHDMRSPIVSLLSRIETYRLNHPEIDQREQTFIDQLEYFARKNLDYSEDFLQLSRAENIDDEIFQLVDMHGVVDSAFAQVHGYAQRNQVNIGIERTDADCWVFGDVQLLERTVANVLNNAIQHTAPNKDVVLSLTLVAPHGIQVAITDQGEGIPADLLPHLFEPYFRARKKRQQTAKETGVVQGVASYGLGLSFVHTVVNRHGGSVHVDSVLGKGSVFTLKFPAAEID